MNLFPDYTFFLHLVIFIVTIFVVYFMILKPFLTVILNRRSVIASYQSNTADLISRYSNLNLQYSEAMQKARAEASMHIKEITQNMQRTEAEETRKLTQNASELLKKIKTNIESTVAEEFHKFPSIRKELVKDVLNKLEN